MLLRRQPQQRGADQRRHARDRRGATPRAGASAAASAARAGAGRRPRSTTRQRHGGAGGATTLDDRLDRRAAKVVRSTSWRRTTRRGRPRSAAGVEPAAQPDSAGDVVRARRRREAVEEPEPLLGEGERGAAGSRGTGTRGGPRSPPPAARVSIRRASSATVGASNRRRSGSSTPKAARIREITWVASSEWPPRSKKSSWTPTRSTRSTLGPDRGQQLLDRGARRHAAGLLPRRRSGAGSALRSTLPLGVSGSAGEAARRPPGPCSPAAAPRRRLAQAGRRPPRRRHVGHQARLARQRPRGPRTTASRTAGCARAAPPRSPRARCGSRGS